MLTRAETKSSAYWWNVPHHQTDPFIEYLEDGLQASNDARPLCVDVR
jgi:hypothetical protein